MLPIFVKGRQVAFSKRFVRLTGRMMSVEPEDLLTPWGFFIPSDALGFGLLEWLRYGRAAQMIRIEEISGILIDHRGDIHEFIMDVSIRIKNELDRFSSREGSTRIDLNDNAVVVRVSRTYVPVCDSLNYAMCSVSEYERDAAAALDASKTLVGAIDLYMKRSPIQTAEYVALDIDNIKQVLTERGMTKDIPMKWTSQMTEEEIKEFDDLVQKERESKSKTFKLPDHI
jgi:hypothetical protein